MPQLKKLNIYQDVYVDSFLKFHTFLLTDPYNKSLNSNSKLLYTLLLNRAMLSRKNNWIDENGDVYFVYSNEDLATAMGVSVKTITRSKKDLQACELLIEQQTGRANRMYIYYPEKVTEKQIDQIDELTTPNTTDASKRTEEELKKLSDSMKTTKAKQEDSTYTDEVERTKSPFYFESLSEQRFKDLRKKLFGQNDLSDVSESPASYINKTDLKRDIKDIQDLSNENKLDSLFNNSLSKEQVQELHDLELLEDSNFEDTYGEKTLSLIRTLSFKDFEIENTLRGLVIKAHTKSESQKTNQKYLYDEDYREFWKFELANLLHKLIFKVNRDKDLIKNKENYMFIALKNHFDDCTSIAEREFETIK